jgi:hypothetical protein
MSLERDVAAAFWQANHYRVALQGICDRLRPFVEGGEPAAEDAVDIYETAKHALDTASDAYNARQA